MIEELNPWWFGEKDEDIEEMQKFEYKFYPKWVDGLSLKPFSLNFVTGLRRVGKTLGMKILIEKLLKRKKNPFSIFYFTCDILEDYEDLLNIFEEYRKLKERKGIKNSYIFLDEITLLDEWWRAVKFLIDRHYFKNDVLVLSGSSSLMIKQHSETFGGRMGSGKFIDVYPLNFKEYYYLFYKDFFEKTGKKAFENYIKTGGFLAVLNKKLREHELISLIKADLKKIERSTDIARDVIASILNKAPSACSYHSIAKDIGISVNTVRDYIEIFKNLFIVLEVGYKGLDNKLYPRKEKKFVIRDPFLAKSLALWCGKKVKKDFLYEWIVQEHLFRKFGEIYYYRNRYEIDCVAGNLKIEVKAGKPHRKYPRNVLILDENDLPRFLVEILDKNE